MTILALSVSGQFIEFIGAKSSEESPSSNSQTSDKSQPNQLESNRKQSEKKGSQKKKGKEKLVANQRRQDQVNYGSKTGKFNYHIHTRTTRGKGEGERSGGYARIYGYGRTDAMFL